MEKSRLFVCLILIGICFSLAFVISAEQDNTFSRDDAVKAINDSQLVIEDMKKNSFSVNYASDLLIEAQRTLQTVDYAEILRDLNANAALRAEASRALNLVNWKNLNYSAIIEYTDKIIEARDKAFLILDSLTAVNLRIENEKKIGTDTSNVEIIVKQAQESFIAERYDESLSWITNANSELDKVAQEKARLAVFKSFSVNFFQKYWIYMVIIFILGFILFLFLRGRIKKYNLIKKITHLKAEQQVLTTLMIRTQNERYKENKISGLVYNIRIKKYQERINEIKESLPVLEAKLHDKKIGKKKIKVE
ncbi:MAG: hypothetical protein AABX17_00560 [Nanoarchaeota archaeon]